MFYNLGILAHVDAGKTTLTEQLLFVSGAIREAGSVDSGTTRTDSLPIERQRGISVRSATASLSWKDKTINIIDTPGHVDFAGEVERCLAALDFAVLVISAPDGIKAHTENLINALNHISLPYLVFINKLDRAGSDTKGVIGELRKLCPGSVCMQAFDPVNEGEENCEADFDRFYQNATEALAEFDNEAQEAFLDDSCLDPVIIKEKLASAVSELRIIPILGGSAKNGKGVKELLDFITDYMPDSSKKASEDLSGIIFKIEHDRSMGKLAHIRLFGGELKSRDSVSVISVESLKSGIQAESDAVPIDEEEDAKDKISQIKKSNGGKYTDCGRVEAGDIAVLCGLTKAKAGRFIGSASDFSGFDLAHPLLRVRAAPVSDHPEALPMLAKALKDLSDEEPYIDAKWENGQSEIVINLTGSIQSEIIRSMLSERYGLEANFSAPTVIYKETPSNKGVGIGVYTMPKPCWAIVQFMFEPMPRGYGVSYHGRIPNNQLFYRYQSHIHRSFESSLEQGLHGWEVTDFKCTLIGGEHHTVHTHPLDFFVATPMAFMNTLENCGSTLLEPLMKMRVIAPAEFVGRIIQEIVRGRGEYEPPFIRSDSATIDSIVPFADFTDFSSKLASFTSGKGVLSTSFYGYREAGPGHGEDAPRRGVDPRDRSKWILWARGAMSESQI